MLVIKLGLSTITCVFYNMYKTDIKDSYKYNNHMVTKLMYTIAIYQYNKMTKGKGQNSTVIA